MPEATERKIEEKTEKKYPFAVKTLVAVCGIALCLACVFLLPLWGTALLVSAVNAMMYYEFSNAFGFLKNYNISIPGFIASCVYPWLFFFNLSKNTFILTVFAALALSFFLSLFKKENDADELVFSIFSFSVFPVINSLNVEILAGDNGKLLIIFPYVCAWGADTFAQITGRICGKHPLIKSVSPNKTVEGFIGGVIGGTILGVLAYFIISKYVSGLQPVIIAVSVFGTLLSSLGDLFFSYIKRSRNIKDFSNLMPGHGGILDRFDSVMFVLPAFAVTLVR